MKQYISNKLSCALFAAVFLLFALSGCERELSDDAVFAEFPNTAEVFTDDPVGLGSDFYFPYAGSNPTAFSVDDEVTYEGERSIRIDVPNANDSNGNYAGAIFRIDGGGRNLTGFDALTFWAKASQAVTIGEMGFGEDFGENKFVTTLPNLSLTTNWRKYVIPIPDPSKLVRERGVLRYSAGTQDTNGLGYTFWIDELMFENLGTVAQARPAIMGGEDIVVDTFNGVTTQLTGLTQTFSTSSNGDVTVNAAPGYYTFSSSNPDVATVDEQGNVMVRTDGTAIITAILGGVAADGSLTLNSLGNFTPAPTPDEDPSQVISIFSDAYSNVPVDYYNGFFAPFQTTLGGAINVGGQNIISYTNLNFVGIGTFVDVPSVDATGMTHMHVDINVRESLDAGDFLRLQLINSVGNNETSGDFTIDGSELASQEWRSFDIPLSSFSGPADRSQLGLYFFISDATISSIYVDNLYFYNE